ncbi:MAG: exopolysaccharide biosynthesis polyprenyl glycosylphosphotransferase [Bdellovibrionaceae bacterium]|nr:exopolysaccharide biosynthesis polyprenyl glycosylphosphotransferase [Pseudobdellovibrionaceae bacterium]
MKIRLTARNKFLLLLFDGFVYLLAVHLFSWFRLQEFAWHFNSPGLWFITFSLLGFNYIFGTYDVEPHHRFKDIFIRQASSFVMTIAFVLTINYLLSKDRSGIFGRGILIGSTVLFGFMAMTYRRILWGYQTRQAVKSSYLFLADVNHNAFIESEIVKKFKINHEILNWQPSQSLAKIHQDWQAIVVSLPSGAWNQNLTDELMKVRFAGVEILNLSQFFEEIEKKVPVDFLSQEWFIFEKGFELFHNPLGLRVKRILDLMLALVLLAITWPIILVFAILIKLESKGPAFYSQIRTGLNDREFLIFKLRSMITDAEKQGAQWAKSNDSRVTRMGKIIRLTRIDELPQLWNVIKGDMSFIGPRPERPEFNVDLEKKIPFYKLRHLVRPGITGWAQVMYAYGASVEDSKQKLQFDLYYIKNFSFVLDMLIIFKTVRVVLFGKGR